MPVKFEGLSEYRRRYEGGTDPANPPLPAFYQRPAEDTTPAQADNGVTREPPLQHKKRPVQSDSCPTVSASYTTLEPAIQRRKKPAQQPKVAESVPTQLEPVPVPVPVPVQESGLDVWKSGEEYILLGNSEKFTPNIKYKAKPMPVRQSAEAVEPAAVTPAAPRPITKPAPKVSVDTGAPNPAKKKLAANGVEKPKPVFKTSQTANKPSVKITAPKPVLSADEPRGRSREKKQSVKKSNTDVGHVTVQQQQQPQQPAPQQKQSSPPQQQQQQPAAAAAESDYALKYKAGIAPPRTKGPKRLSEYQLQFGWKQGAGSSPLLDAEQVVYKSSTQLVPQRAEFAKSSEYKKQFQAWDIPPKPQISTTEAASSKKAVAKRSKSVDASRSDPAGVTRVTSDHDPRLVQESLNPLRLHFPHGPQKKEVSEYAVNFAPPTAFSYEQGAWKASKPAQEQDVEPGSWYAEVQELRQKAEEYKKRAQGTHFSRQHVAQLLARQSAMWDTASTSSVLSALSLEHATRPAVPEVSPDVRPAGKRTAWGCDREPRVDAVERASTVSRDDLSEAAHNSVSARSDASTLVAVTQDPGRIPTPSMPDGKRHHLDRTTPLVGGAVLTSPKNNEEKKRRGKRMVSSAASQASSLSVPESLDVCPPSVRDPANRTPKEQVRYTHGESPGEIPQVESPLEDEYELRDAAVQTLKQVSKAKEPKEKKSVRSCGSKKPAVPRQRSSQSATDHAQPSPTYDSSQFQKVMDTLGKIQTKILQESAPKPKPKRRQVTPDPTRYSLTEDDRDLSLAERLQRQIQLAEELRQTSKSVDALIRPTYGKPTPDAHLLLDDDASTDRPLDTKFLASPPQAKQARHNRAAFPSVSVPSTIQETTASHRGTRAATTEVTLDDIPPRPLDYDVLSVSARSVVSSCSMASEVLERARQHRDQFWGTANGLSGPV